MLDDNPYELKFSLRKFFEAINVPIILRKQNFASNIVSMRLLLNAHQSF